MLQSLELINFKSFVNQKFDLKPLTILAGLNGSGKSSVVEAINLIHNLHTLTWQKHIQSNFNRNQFISFKSLLSINNGYKISAKWNGENIFLNASFKDDFLNVETDESYNFSDYDMQILLASRVGPQSAYVLNPLSKDVSLDYNGRSIVDYILKLNDSNVKIDESLKYEKAVSFKDNVSDWLQIISPNSNLTFKIEQDGKNARVFYNGIVASETGFGLSFTIPVIATLLDPNIKMLIIENPEAHLHPKGQSQLAKLIAKAVTSGKQVVLETHSDHIIDGIRVAVKQHMIRNDNVGIFFLDRKLDEPSEVTSISVDSFGNLSEWPEDFFDQGLVDAGELL